MFLYNKSKIITVNEKYINNFAYKNLINRKGRKER